MDLVVAAVYTYKYVQTREWTHSRYCVCIPCGVVNGKETSKYFCTCTETKASSVVNPLSQNLFPYISYRSCLMHHTHVPVPVCVVKICSFQCKAMWEFVQPSDHIVGELNIRYACNRTKLVLSFSHRRPKCIFHLWTLLDDAILHRIKTNTKTNWQICGITEWRHNITAQSDSTAFHT